MLLFLTPVVGHGTLCGSSFSECLKYEAFFIQLRGIQCLTHSVNLSLGSKNSILPDLTLFFELVTPETRFCPVPGYLDTQSQPRVLIEHTAYPLRKSCRLSCFKSYWRVMSSLSQMSNQIL